MESRRCVFPRFLLPKKYSVLKEEESLQNWRAASKAIFEPPETMKLENEYSGCEGKSNMNWRDKGSLLDMIRLIFVVGKGWFSYTIVMRWNHLGCICTGPICISTIDRLNDRGLMITVHIQPSFR